jgi:hypothetical protein
MVKAFCFAFSAHHKRASMMAWNVINRRTKMVARASAARAAAHGASPRDHTSAMRTGYLQALMNPKTGPLVGIPTFIPIQTQRQRVRAVASLSTTTGALTVNVNPRRMVANDTGPVRACTQDGATDAGWVGSATGYQAINNNAEHSGADFGDGSDLKARVVALQVTVKNVSSLNNRNGMFYALQERHHHNLAGKTSSDVSSDAHCKIQSATDGDITLLYRPVQPREVEEWQVDAGSYPGETSNPTADDGPLDTFPGFMAVYWKGSTGVAQNFFVEVDAIIEYAGETKDLLSSDPHTGAPGATAAQPRDIPIIVSQVQQAEANPAHHRSILSQIGRAIGSAVNPLTRRGRANLGQVGRTAGYLRAAYRAGGLPGVGVAASYGIGRAAGGAIRGAYTRRPRSMARNYSPYRRFM